MTVAIPVGKHNVAFIDHQDFEIVSKHKWCLALTTSPTLRYAMTAFHINGRKTTIRMHRLILGLTLGDGKVSDHKDGDGLNNRRSTNLRVSTHQQNMWNKGPHKNNSLGQKFISPTPNGGYSVRIMCNGARRTRTVRTLEEAITLRAAWAAEIHGGFARVQ